MIMKKEIDEENVSVKILMPLLDGMELQSIDTFYNDIVSEYTKAFVKEKEQVIAQRLMMNLQQENARLKEIENKLNFIKNRKNQGASQENINKMAIEFVNSYLKEV